MVYRGHESYVRGLRRPHFRLAGRGWFLRTHLRLVAKAGGGSDNRLVKKMATPRAPRDKKLSSAVDDAAAPPDFFSSGAMVIVTLGTPREKFWGLILGLAPAGLSLSGIDLSALEDFALMVKEGQPFTPTVVFFPMHRIERVELDLPVGTLPSLSQRFLASTGLQAAASLAPAEQTISRTSRGLANSSRQGGRR